MLLSCLFFETFLRLYYNQVPKGFMLWLLVCLSGDERNVRRQAFVFANKFILLAEKSMVVNHQIMDGRLLATYQVPGTHTRPNPTSIMETACQKCLDVAKISAVTFPYRFLRQGILIFMNQYLRRSPRHCCLVQMGSIELHNHKTFLLFD